MSSPQDSVALPREGITAQSPPYPPHNQGLGGTPDVIPDIPIAVIFIVLYLAFGIIHIKILKNNKSRGHKFIFNGAVLGLCKVRIVTMSLRIAWACYPRNTSLAIAANVFTYVGTIILFIINWFFVQRIVRAQHARLGWSTPYRIFHRVGLALLIGTLIMLIVASIWQFFTLDDKKLRVFRGLQLTGQTYFTIFCVAPAVLVIISLLLPRREIEKFGAGRLRNNITILLLAVFVLATGQTFRCVIAWIPQTPIRDAVGRYFDTPWYLRKACFYGFNFVTEIVVVIMFALVRVDLRFHIPNGSRMSGDYSARNSRVTVNTLSSEKALSASAPIVPLMHHNDSAETLHQYNTSIFDDSNTLAESLQYPGSTLEVDAKTGNWKVKRVSTGSTSSRDSLRSSSASRSSLHDRVVTFADEDVPPVPEIPAEWPLPASPLRGSSVSIWEQSNPPSRKSTPKRHFEIKDHQLNNVDVGDAITDALAKLEQNSEQRNSKLPKGQTRFPVKVAKSPKTPPPEYSDVARESVGKGAPLGHNDKKTPTRAKNLLAPRERATFPPKSAMKTPRSHSTESHTASNPPTIVKAPKVPQPMPIHAMDAPPAQRSPSLELITLTRRPSADSRQILDLSLQGDKAGEVWRPESWDGIPALSDASVPAGVFRAPSSAYSNATTSSDAREAVKTEEEFRRYRSEALPVLEGDLMRWKRFN